jgi:hypothetical protein
MRFSGCVAESSTWPRAAKNAKLRFFVTAQAQSEFRRAFLSRARVVHRRQALRHALTGAAWGLGLGVLAAFGSWFLRASDLRPFAVTLGGLGAALGSILGRRRRFSDSAVALYLDARLGSHEAVTTALAAHGDDGPALTHVVDHALRVLEHAEPIRIKPKLWSRRHLSVPVALAAIAAISFLPLLPAAKPTPPAPGAERVRIDNLQGLERIEALAQLPGQSPEQDARLKKLAEQAKKLRASLAKGLEKREALSQIAKLRDGIAAERLKLGDRQNRPGLDAALRAFGSNQALRDAQRALSSGDLTAFDDEMQKLANRAESTDRQAAKEALEQAAKEARAKVAPGLADALDSQKRLFEQRQARSEALRELAQAMKGKLSPEAQSDLKEFGRSGDPEAERRLEQGLERALEGLTAEERKRLAERLQKQLGAGAGNASPLSKKQLEAMAKELSRDGGSDALEEQLRELSKPEPSDDAEREQGLGEADRGGSAAERGLGALPVPIDGEGSPAGAAKGGGGDANGSSGPGSPHDPGAGDHHGSTPEIAGKELRSKAEAHLVPGAAPHSATLGRAPARAGETANQLGTGTLGDARSTEIGAVDHADIPEEYREQVGRYFEP